MNPDISDKRVRDLRMQIAAAPRTRDPALHLELAEVLYRRSEFGDALSSIIPALTDPKCRLAALCLLANIVTAQGGSDGAELYRRLAANSEEAQKSMPTRR